MLTAKLYQIEKIMSYIITTTNNPIGEFLSQVKTKSDKAMNYFLAAFFVVGLLLATFYDTWDVAIVVGGLALAAYYSAKLALPDSDLYQYVLSAVFAVFMAQYIYQMHGLFEMHFIAFIGSAMLITYQNWKLQLPLTLLVVAHHAVFGYLQFSGVSEVYFTQLDYMSLQTFIIHVLLAAVIFFICGLWAYQFKLVSEKHIEQSFRIGKLEEEKEKKLAIMAMNASLERKVKERTAELEAVNNELESFSYSVSHDLRAPLRIINGYGKMLLKSSRDKFDARGQEDLQVIMDNATKMGNLIDDLLNFSRLGRANISKNKVNMTDMVRAVTEEVKSGTSTKAEITIHDFEPADCDPALMKQVWVNLISNAVKYSRKRENPKIEIGSTGHNGHQTYYVKDNGVGFDMEHADKLFAVFQRLHKVTEYEGTGVGLSLAQRIITKHGGKIWADGKVDEGATFYFTLTK
jgi:signal transduction histidine kinase